MSEAPKSEVEAVDWSHVNWAASLTDRQCADGQPVDLADYRDTIRSILAENTCLRDEAARARVGWEVCAKWAKNLGADELWYKRQIAGIKASHARTRERDAGK
ncbi:hypothetical protein [Sagittula sp. MA-2]|jgi:hypothetical protein|uniref:hypothetical protein n=1 Tax=Sagittula sp. MA-2 TaxID=3048007 RepID=UPI0024C36388|nr:hypothetical protein [Sagittula sp. MA-2]WHZ35744.1 hypothetical protein QNI11_01770 [Sagittula sp. MA-2]